MPRIFNDTSYSYSLYTLIRHQKQSFIPETHNLSHYHGVRIFIDDNSAQVIQFCIRTNGFNGQSNNFNNFSKPLKYVFSASRKYLLYLLSTFNHPYKHSDFISLIRFSSCTPRLQSNTPESVSITQEFPSMEESATISISIPAPTRSRISSL